MATRPVPQPSLAARAPATNGTPAASAKPEAEIIFQKFFKSVGPRTYASQIKRAHNGNHFLVLTEGKRDEKTGDIRKTKVFVFSEDFGAFFRMLHETAQFIKANPVPEEVRRKREKFWAKRGGSDDDTDVLPPVPPLRSATAARAPVSRPPAARPPAVRPAPARPTPNRPAPAASSSAPASRSTPNRSSKNGSSNSRSHR